MYKLNFYISFEVMFSSLGQLVSSLHKVHFLFSAGGNWFVTGIEVFGKPFKINVFLFPF